MARKVQVASKVEAFSDSASQLSTKLSAALMRLELLQHGRTVMVSGEDTLTPDSYVARPGSPERRLLDDLAMRRAVADVIDQYGKLLAAFAKGTPGNEVRRQRVLFDAATERLAAIAATNAALAASGKDLRADEAKATGPGPTRDEAKAEAVGAKLQGILGVVSKVAGESEPGEVAGVILTISSHVAAAIRSRKGARVVATMAPQAQADIDRLAGVLSATYSALAPAIDGLIADIVACHNQNRAARTDPAAYAFEMSVADLLSQGHDVKAALADIAAAYGGLGPAHREFAEMLSRGADDSGASDHLVKTVAAVAAAARP